MAFFKREPAPAYAADEQQRADGLAQRIQHIQSDPTNPSNGSVPHYQDAYRQASETAAAHTEQPERKGWWQ